MLHDPAARWLDVVYERFPECQVVLLEEAGTPVAFGNTTPVSWSGRVADLPDGGWDAIIARGARGRQANTLCALQAMVRPDRQGQGWSAEIIRAMRAVAAARRSRPRPRVTEDLILRNATPADADALAAFNVRIHAEADPEHVRDRLASWTRDLVARPHPTSAPGDTLIVEDTTTGQIVSTTCLINQTWSYAGIPFEVGRPELVGTLPEYRSRGLIRRQFEVLHRWSAERGQPVQAITGIPWYYRQFGYEMMVNLSGNRIGFGQHVPTLKEDEAEPFAIRLATAADLDFIAEVDALGHQRDTLYCRRDAAAWHYELDGRRENSMWRRILAVIERPDGERVGFIAYPPFTMHKGQAITSFELKPGVSWVEATPSVIRYIWAVGQAAAAAEGGVCEAWAFALGESHPAYQVARGRLPISMGSAETLLLGSVFTLRARSTLSSARLPLQEN